MGILYLVAFAIYIVIAVVIYKAVKQLKDKWASRLILAFLILLPTYDIIITKALLFYYCNFTETEKVYRTIENPESVYFENKVDYPNGYPERRQNFYVDSFFNRGKLTSLEMYVGRNKVIKYFKDTKIKKEILPVEKISSMFSRVKKEIDGFFIDTIIYEFYDLNNHQLLGYIKLYYGRTPNIFFITPTGSKALGGSCSDSIYKLDEVVLKLR